MTPARCLVAALAASQVVYGVGRAPRSATTTRALVMLILLTSITESQEARARRGGLSLAAAGGVGFVAELVGVATGRPFGSYSYSARLGPRVAGVPLLAAAAWAMMARPAWITAGWVSPHPVRRVPLAAAALTAWDVFLDPRMVREGYWTWPCGGRYADVPASNFAGWFLTGLVAFTAMSAVDFTAPDARDDGALILYAWTWVGEAFANAVLWRQPRIALAGGTAMGAVAIPALARRRRR